MADLNTVVEDATESSPVNRKSKPRVSAPRTSLLPTSVTGIGGSLAASRGRRQSSRTSIPRAGLDPRLIRYENTYRMEPDDDHRVDIARLRRVATSVIDTAVSTYKYDPKQGEEFACALADRVRAQIKQLPFSRYKIIVQVVIGQKRDQDLRVTSRCIWDVKFDRHFTISKETNDAYVTVTMFLVYTE